MNCWVDNFQSINILNKDIYNIYRSKSSNSQMPNIGKTKNNRTTEQSFVNFHYNDDNDDDDDDDEFIIRTSRICP